MKNLLILLTFILLMDACETKNNRMVENLDIQGHRGCRGLLPENTIEGFIRAVELGVTTLELDVVISADSQIVVSHEAFFNHEITTLPNGDTLSKETEKNYNIYKMNLADIQKIDVGLKPVKRFPLQTRQKAFKPTLRQVVDSISHYITANNLPEIQYNIEIKHQKDLDNIMNPTADVFVRLVYNEVVKLGIKSKCNIQSFDLECLNILHKIDSSVVIAVLIENQDPFMDNLAKLDFTPDIYSPYFKLISPELMEYCNKNSISLIPWTINDEKDISTYISMGIDGIITDYPDKAIEIYEGLKLEKK